jgi:hypothetical protein
MSKSFRLHLGDFALRLADHDRHIGVMHPSQALSDRIADLGWCFCQTVLFFSQQVSPVRFDFVEHADGGRLVDGDEHRLSSVAAPGEMAHKVDGDLL